jgi:hypothetical protein
MFRDDEFLKGWVITFISFEIFIVSCKHTRNSFRIYFFSVPNVRIATRSKDAQAGIIRIFVLHFEVRGFKMNRKIRQTSN